MPESAMWALIVSLVILAISLALKIVQLEHRLKLSENEPSRLMSEMAMLKEEHNKEISDIKELNQRKIEELTEQINNIHIDSCQTIEGLDDTDVELLRIIATLEKPFDIGHIIDNRYLSIKIASLKLSPQDLKYRLQKLHKTNYIDYDLYGGLQGLTYSGRSFLKSKNRLP